MKLIGSSAKLMKDLVDEGGLKDVDIDFKKLARRKAREKADKKGDPDKYDEAKMLMELKRIRREKELRKRIQEFK